MKYLIYALVDPFSGECRYVGQSTTGMQRPRQHKTPSQLKRSTPEKVAWIRSLLLARGVCYEIVVLYQSQVREGLGKAEMYWIAEMKARGARLTNVSRGGLGSAWTPEMKARASEAARRGWADPEIRARRGTAVSESGRLRRGRRPGPYVRANHRAAMNRPETKERLRQVIQNETPEQHQKREAPRLAAVLGKPQSPATIEKRAASNRGQKRTAEVCAKISAANKGRVRTAEARSNISAAARKYTREEVEVWAAAYEAGATFQEVAERFGVKPGTMYERLRIYGVKRRDSLGRPKAEQGAAGKYVDHSKAKA